LKQKPKMRMFYNYVLRLCFTACIARHFFMNYLSLPLTNQRLNPLIFVLNSAPVFTNLLLPAVKGMR